MCANNCEAYWNLANYFPFPEAIRHWCDGSEQCIEARSAALLTALEEGLVKYRRRDGKTWEEPVYQLQKKGNLLVERETFLAWAKSVSNEIEQQALQTNVSLAPRAENTYLNIIGALVDLVLTGKSNARPYSVFTSQSDLINKLLLEYPGTPGVSQRTLEDKFAAAKRQLKGN